MKFHLVRSGSVAARAKKGASEASRGRSFRIHRTCFTALLIEVKLSDLVNRLIFLVGIVDNFWVQTGVFENVSYS